jgi:UDP-GlcNAc:undecaprenyl-phosphate/decaprenyl-phosphate GlcNAc-1-phosphate transferase
VTFEGPWVLAAVALFVAALLTNMLVPLVARVAVALRAVDYPGERRVQERPVPRLGGLALVAGLAFSAGGLFLIRWPSLHGEFGRVGILTLAAATFIIFVLGIIDDVVGVSAGRKFLIQALAAGLVVQVGWSFERLSLPGGVVELGWLGPLLSLLWIVGVTNAINLIDGMDGLAGGVVGIIALSLLTYAGLLGETGTVILMAATAGACLGFLRHNWAPAKIFMGDSGSLTLGFLLAVASVHSAIKAPAAVAILVPLLALGLPVIDTLLVMLVRFLARPKGAAATRFLAMFHADRSHIHHLLLRFGTSRQRVVMWIYAAVLAFCVFAMLVATTQNPLLGAVLLPLELGVIVAMRSLGLRREAQKISARERSELKSDLVDPERRPPSGVVRPIDSRLRRRG